MVVADPALALDKRLRYLDREKEAMIEAVWSPPREPDPARSTVVAERMPKGNRYFGITTGRDHGRNTVQSDVDKEGTERG